MSATNTSAADENREKWIWPQDEIRRVGYRVIDLIADHLDRIAEKPVFRPFPKELVESYLSSIPPKTGINADEILDKFEGEISPFPFGNGSPRFYGWVNSPPVVLGVFAEALAAAMNPSCAGGNHAAIYVERQVIDWFRQVVGFPNEAMGLLVSGGSAAALTALAIARQVKCNFDIRAKGLRETKSALVFYRTREAHSCHQKVIELLGIGSENLRVVAHDGSLRMIPDALDKAIEKDVAAGSIPIAVIASAGTVNTGAIDPIHEIAEVCSRHNTWLHVDGAYGAAAILSERFPGLRALSRADSIALDPHKWLYIPVEAGLVLVRNRKSMRDTFSLVPPYLQTDDNIEGVAGPPWFSEYGYQQTRGFRALKVWMALQFHGINGYKESIERDIALARALADAVRNSPDFELYEPQNLSIVCFRFVSTKKQANSETINSQNKTLLERLQLGGEVFLSGTTIDGDFWLRACIVNPRTELADIERIVPVIRETAAASPTM